MKRLVRLETLELLVTLKVLGPKSLHILIEFQERKTSLKEPGLMLRVRNQPMN